MSALTYGLLVAVVGMAIVFVGLISLIVVIIIQSGIFQSIDKRKAAKAALADAETPAAIEEPVSEPLALVEEDEDDEVAAVIAAAIAMMEAEGGQKLRVKSIRRVAAPAWGQAGRREAIANKL